MNLNSLFEAITDYERLTNETVDNYDYTEYINGVFLIPKRGDTMNLHSWITKYEQKAEPFTHIPTGFTIHFEPDKGFFCWQACGSIFVVTHTCTNDIKHFYRKANEMAKEHGCTLMRTNTAHDPAAYWRLIRGENARLNLPISHVENGRMYWFFEKDVD